MKADRFYELLLEKAKADPDVLGFILEGSRGKGAATRHSDYDVHIVVKDGTLRKQMRKYPFNVRRNDFDVRIQDLASFRKDSAFGGPKDWNRYNYAHLKAQIDKTGEIQKLVDEKSRVPKDKLRRYTRRTLDAYINQVYRSLKCLSDGERMGFRLEAAREVPLFIDLLFALDGRVSPYYKYLRWELANHPVSQFPMGKDEVLKSVMRILNTGSPRDQQRLLALVEKTLRKRGYGSVFDGWTVEKMAWMERTKAG